VNTQKEQSQWEIEESSEQTITSASLGKLSVLAAVIGIVLKFGGDAVFEAQSSAATSIGIAAALIVGAGISLGGYGLMRAYKCFSIDMLLVAGVGIFLNGGLFAMGIVKLPIPGQFGLGPESVSARGINIRQALAEGGFAVATENWMAGLPCEVTDKDFNNVVGNSKAPVLVYFWSFQSEHCKMMEPIVEEIARMYESRVKVCKLNADIEKETASSFKLKGIPTIILFKNGQIKAKWVGPIEQRYITSAIEKLP
jgi:thioredoxin 1